MAPLQTRGTALFASPPPTSPTHAVQSRPSRLLGAVQGREKQHFPTNPRPHPSPSRDRADPGSARGWRRLRVALGVFAPIALRPGMPPGPEPPWDGLQSRAHRAPRGAAATHRTGPHSRSRAAVLCTHIPVGEHQTMLAFSSHCPSCASVFPPALGAHFADQQQREAVNIAAIPLTLRLPAHPKPRGFCTVSFSDSPPFDALPVPAPSPGAGGTWAALGLHRAKATPGVGWENSPRPPPGLRGTQRLCNCAGSPSLTQPRALPKPPPPSPAMLKHFFSRALGAMGPADGSPLVGCVCSDPASRREQTAARRAAEPLRPEPFFSNHFKLSFLLKPQQGTLCKANE